MNGDASLGISIIAIICSFIAIYISYKQYKLSKTINMVRPHSDRISDMFREWLSSDEALPHVFTPTNIPDERLKNIEHILSSIKEEEYSLNLNPLALEHLKTGYPDIYNLLEAILKEIRVHNQSILEYFLSLCNEVKNVLKLPEPSHLTEKFAYYSRIIIYTSQNVLTGYPKGDPFIEAPPSTPGRCELKWEGATLVRGNEQDCKNGLEVVKNIRMTKADKIKEFDKNAKDLNSKIDRLFEEMRLRLVDYIKAGGKVKGKCTVCSKDAN